MPLTIPTIDQLKARVNDPFFYKTEFGDLKKVFVDNTKPNGGNGTSSLPYNSLEFIKNVPTGTAVIIMPSPQPYHVPDGGLLLNDYCIITGNPIPGAGYPVLEGLPYTLSGKLMPTTADDIRVRQVIDVGGNYCRIENLDIQDGFRHDIVLRGQHSVVKSCLISGAFEDAIKVANTVENTSSADWGLIAYNSITKFASQGIDLYGAKNYLIHNNYFNYPIADPVNHKVIANAAGFKGGAKNVIFLSNEVRNMLGGSVVLGGAGTNFDMPTEDCVAAYNKINGVSIGISMQSAVQAEAYYNSIYATIGIDIGIDGDIRIGQPNSAYCKDIKLGGNNIQLAVTNGVNIRTTAKDAEGLIIGNSIYDTDRFIYEYQLMNYDQFIHMINPSA